ncbi:Retrovirus-related Pol polyprotein from transposon RE1 [Vitis vinifera]|uniref:Retrovirus-related Pol polyprotein from transposon RE1 n=2 Tax=Vitis vinifera TaxID=29760 RepID=A0A438DKZ2_VITVI|nr:Retrovirus-related Pol polyprotein from transposon RE1 [Vitis vinifera]
MEEGFQETLTATVTEIKTEANVVEKVSALVVTTDYGDRSHSLDLPHKKLFLQPMGEYQKEIQTLDCNYHISEKDESGQFELVNQEAEALADPRWKATMNEDMKSLKKNETWELIECPLGKNSVGCRWIYTMKYKPLQQIDVKNAFLHGELSEEVYMDLPPGCMVSEKQCQKVCKLKKSLYELKQSPRAWFGRFTKPIRVFGYHQSNSDHTLFLKKQHGKITTLIVYVNDMVVTGNDPEERKTLQNYLSREFEMKDLGKIPETLGRLMYLAHTRPDLAYALSVVSQYMHNPGEQHMNAVMRILRYLKNAPRNRILFTKNVNHQSIEVYTDANWVGAVDDRRLTSGYFTFVSGNLVTWKSKKQNVVARLSAEAKFRGMTLGLCEASWLRLLLQDLGYLSRQPIRFFCNNKAACDIAHNPVQHDCTKHVKVDGFFIKEKLDDKIVELPKIRSEDQLADILTKVAVSSRVFSKILDKLGMCDIYAPT